jgi:hypothetical protein
MICLGWIGARQAKMKLVLRVIIANILARAITKVLDPLQEYWAAIDSVANPFFTGQNKRIRTDWYCTINSLVPLL